ncbi:MAG: hypothetical protein FWD06_04950 [Oscillospiraceae bacterium]|nr:hypothetical protein [Oscillospiraceae bacterium]
MSKDNLIGLSPPWYTFFNMVKYSIGNDQCVNVLDMQEISEQSFLIPIDVDCCDKARALATIVVSYKKFGNINVYVEVLHHGNVVQPGAAPKGLESLVKLYQQALETNRCFQCVEFRKIFDSVLLFPVFERTVIQFFNDDLSDLYNNFNGIAANVFAEVLRLSVNDIHIYPSTAARKK